jgi:hypothetical protein
MNSTLFPLALQGLLRKRKSSILIFLVLLFSFSFGILSLSLVGSIVKTNEEFRKDTYGGWYYAIPDGLSQDESYLSSQSWVEAYGSMVCYGSIYSESTLNGLGTVEESMISVGRLTLDQGNWPSAEGEIALEADTLSALGYDYTLGQEVTLSVSLPCGEENVEVPYTFRLTGVVHEFSDLWAQDQSGEILPVSAIVTQDTAEQILSQGQSIAAQLGFSLSQPDLEYYIQVDEETLADDTARQNADDQLSQYLTESRSDLTDSSTEPLSNQALLTSNTETQQSDFYLYLIAVVALTAVLCVYLLNLPKEMQSCATLRSLGMTRPQLLVLALDEAILLLVPAILLGIPLGIGLTWAGLKLVAFSGSAAVVVQVPYLKLLGVILLWLCVALLARLVLFLLSLRVPLTGRFQGSHKNNRRLGRLCNVLVVIPLLVLGTAVFLAGFESVMKNADRTEYANLPHYTILGNTDDSYQMAAVPESAQEDLSKLAGVKSVTSYSYCDAFLSYAGLDQRRVQLVILSEDQLDQWDEALDLGADREAFQNGETVLLCFPDSTVDDSHLYLDYAYLQSGEELPTRNYVLPEGEITIGLYNEDQQVLTRQTVSASVRYLTYAADQTSHSVELHSGYTVICSGAWIKQAFSGLGEDVIWTPPYQQTDYAGSQWTVIRYAFGTNFGYRSVELRADSYGNTLLTDNLLATYCKEHDLSLTNNRQTYMALEQEELQGLILTATGSICVGLMALLVLVGVFALEGEQERRRYAVLRAIGLSKGQMWRRILGKALGRGLLTTLGGLFLYLGYKLQSAIYDAAHPTVEYAEPYVLSLADAWTRFKGNWVYYGIDPAFVLWLAVLCLGMVLVLTLLAKRKLGKETFGL